MKTSSLDLECEVKVKGLRSWKLFCVFLRQWLQAAEGEMGTIIIVFIILSIFIFFIIFIFIIFIIFICVIYIMVWVHLVHLVQVSPGESRCPSV